MKERETLKQARQHANRKCTETTIEDQTRREKVAQKRTEKRNMELPHQAESRRGKDAKKAGKKSMETQQQADSQKARNAQNNKPE